jgi:predicted transcriptional regulator
VTISPDRAQAILSPGEWKIFHLLTRRHPLTVAQVAQELAREDPEFSLNVNTVKTFAERLHRKGYLSRDLDSSASQPRRGREPFLYSPAVPLEPALRLHLHRFLDQFALGGDPDLEIAQRLLEERRAALKAR